MVVNSLRTGDIEQIREAWYTADSTWSVPKASCLLSVKAFAHPPKLSEALGKFILFLKCSAFPLTFKKIFLFIDLEREEERERETSM